MKTADLIADLARDLKPVAAGAVARRLAAPLLVATAINEFLGNGFDRYELMAGQAEYKRSLAMAEGSMAWLSIDRVGWRARIVDLFRRRRGQDALP